MRFYLFYLFYLFYIVKYKKVLDDDL